MRIEKRKSTILSAVSITLLLTCFAAPRAGANESQSSAAPQAPRVSETMTPAANPADVGSINAIVHAAYDTISGPAGQQRDWNRFRSLFVPGARLIPVASNSAGEFHAAVHSVDDYVARGEAYLQKNGFFEREVARRTERFAGIAQVFSTYESRHAAADAKPFERGINSFQLMNDGRRWWIVTIFWQGETPESPIPQEFLQGVK